MPRLFTRIITFKVEGEIYDLDTKAEDIIKNYTFAFKDYSDGKDHFFIEGTHKDIRGRIIKITRLPNIHKWKKPDTEFFLKL
jgi:hypothetical protein